MKLRVLRGAQNNEKDWFYRINNFNRTRRYNRSFLLSNASDSLVKKIFNRRYNYEGQTNGY